MRNFEERRAEIFRRSEERIKERARTRRATVVSCASLAVCVIVLSAALLPDMMTKKESASDQNNAEEINDADEMRDTLDTSIHGANYGKSENNSSQSLVSVYKLAEVSVLNGEIASYRRIENADEIVQLWKLLSGYTEDSSSVASEYDQSSENEALSDGMLYTITLTAHEGETEIYTLLGNILTDKDGKENKLEEDQLKALIKAISIE